MYGRWVSPDKTLSLPAQTRACAGRITRSSRTTAAGMEWLPITIITGMTPFIIASATLAETIRHSLATIFSTALTLPAQRSVTTAWVTRLGWRPAQGGLVAVTWTWATALPPDTSSACSGSLLLPGLAEAIPTRPKRLTLPSIPGVVRLRKVVRLTRCKLLWQLREPP